MSIQREFIVIDGNSFIHRALVKMSQFLATIKCDVELDVTLDGVEYAEPEMEALMAYADEYELYDSPLMRRFFDSP